ncbi:hypothetical protein [Burkholderia sp. BCC0397]|nr:hypothetical protein [Burkholderia sp. BCC0397]
MDQQEVRARGGIGGRAVRSQAGGWNDRDSVTRREAFVMND